ncbi:uncharacterized [Lates japonicus]
MDSAINEDTDGTEVLMDLHESAENPELEDTTKLHHRQGLLVQLLKPGQKHQLSPHKPNRCHHFVHNQSLCTMKKFFETRTEAPRIQTSTIKSQRRDRCKDISERSSAAVVFSSCRDKNTC